MKFALLTGVWMAFMVGAFWKFEGSYLVPVRPRVTPAESELSKTGIATTANRIVVLNFWNPDCGCSSFAEPHVRQLAQTYCDAEFVTVIVTEPSQAKEAKAKAISRHLPGKFLIDADGKLCRKLGIPAAPAAVVYDRTGKQVYRGSYNIARFCDDKATAFVEQTLFALTTGKSAMPKSLPFYGCHTVAAK